jgi:glycosyltransferase involved in cell wall biosynthesis
MAQNMLLNQKLSMTAYKNYSNFSLDNFVTNTKVTSEPQLAEILFITSYPPRECGIATYSQDLINAINNKFDNTFNCTICALESDSEQHVYKQTPCHILNTDQNNSFAKMAFAINRNDNIQLVVMQHEFGFFAKKEVEFKLFFETISKPIVFVFHTVLPNPDSKLKIKVQDMSTIASSIIVMTNNAAKILVDDYQVPVYKITVIQHGTHLIPTIDKEQLKKQYNCSNRMILSTFGLLSSSKGIETTLDALPDIIKQHANVLFLILGKTHPTVAKNDGEVYRNMLQEKVNYLQLQNHVQFVNEYLHLPKLLSYLQLTDIYLFTSKDPNQAVSGTFSYALSAGCAIVSTPIPHAKEILQNDCGIIVDFSSPHQISTAVIGLLDDESARKNLSLNGLHKMAPTAWENAAIAHAKLFQSLITDSINLNYKLPEININHVQRLTTAIGMIQFSNIDQPNIKSGFTLDDNARALIAICKVYTSSATPYTLNLIQIYLQFIKKCLQPNGQFLNYVNEHQQFTKQNYSENLEDSNGRAIWALGYFSSLSDLLPKHLIIEASNILQKAIPNLINIHSTRAMAFIIKGLHYEGNTTNLPLIKILADRLVQMYKHESKNDWLWFEDSLTYGNSLLPEALLCAFISTNNTTYKNIAKESFDFLLSKIFTGNKINVISNKGWMLKNDIAKAEIGGEQPIDVAYTVIALEKFYTVFKKEVYKQKAIIAFNWFLGENHLHQIIYNPCTGGCYDGLEATSVNLNQGAESTISCLMARVSIEAILLETAIAIPFVGKHKKILKKQLTF